MSDPVFVPASISQRIARIARSFAAVQYDAYDPHRRAIETAAQAAGLRLCPSEQVTPRTIEGCTPPPPADDPEAAIHALATVLHQILCTDPTYADHREPSYSDHARASLTTAALASHGWILTAAPAEHQPPRPDATAPTAPTP